MTGLPLRRTLAPTLALAAAAALAAQAPEPPADDGWVDLFDGSTLAGWVTAGGRYDGDARWSVEDGAIVGRRGPAGEGGLLYTDRYYHSFELELDVLLEWPFDSGVFLRMLPPARGGKGLQITLDHRPGGEIGAVYADGFLQHNETGDEHYRRGEWNKLRVRSTGLMPRVEAWLNGHRVTDYRLPEDAEGYAESGRIGLQVHPAKPGDEVARFRGIRIRELPVHEPDEFDVAADGSLVPRPDNTGWRALLAGDDLGAWEAHGGDGSGFAVRSGVLTLLRAGGAQNLRSIDDFRDFDLRLDFELAAMANSGVFLRAARSDANPAYSGCEVQLLDDWNWERITGTRLRPWQFTGSLYGAVPPGVGDALNPIGAWNSLQISFRGSRLTTQLNGWLLYDVDTAKLTPEQGPAFAERAASGFIGIQRHAPAGAGDDAGDAYARIRNIWIRPLD